MRHFAVNGDVEMWTRTGLRKPVGVADAAVIKHFYSYASDVAGRDTTLEQYLDAQVEADAGARINRIVSGCAGSGDLDAAGRFAMFQLARSPRFRELDEKLEERLGPLLAGFDAVSAFRQQNPELDWDEEQVRRIFDDAQANPSPAYTPSRDRNSRIRVFVRHADRLAARAAELAWSVAEHPRPVFCLSDSPAVLFDPTLDPLGFGGFEVKPTVELRLPLSPRHVLLGVVPDHQIGPRHFMATDEMAVSTNRLVARECRHAAFIKPGTTPLGDIVLAPTPPPLPEPTITMQPRHGPPSNPAFPEIIDDRLRDIIDASETPT